MNNIIFILILLFLGLILANLAESRGNQAMKRWLHWLFGVANLPILGIGLVLCFASLPLQITLRQATTWRALVPAGIILILSASWGVLVVFRPVRAFLARLFPLNPDSVIHTLALTLVGYLIGNTFLTLSQGGLDRLAETGIATTIAQIVATGLFFTIVGLLGVGLFTRRDWPAVCQRLGLGWPSGRDLLGGLRWIITLVILQAVIGGIFYWLTPDQAKTQIEINSLLMDNIDTVGEWLILALATGISEEILFRGALQPVLGLWPTALIFALAHFQYGFTLITATIFLIGLVLGQIRQRQNTSTAIFIHVLYNFVLGLFSLLASNLLSSQ